MDVKQLIKEIKNEIGDESLNKNASDSGVTDDNARTEAHKGGINDVLPENGIVAGEEKAANPIASIAAIASDPEKLEKIASDLENDSSDNATLEKIASDIESAETVSDIIKIAEAYGDNEIKHLAVVAEKIVDIIAREIKK